ncbi:hypothetical protein AV530_016353 [Patagioenas fasciata monilis]|uniref:Uncharacterized protein n=1 Tax=Patagioenas fasciata monilis TaxID=372326 RepID=A0A1V4KPW3_PATFA|nr:hypothetical protein AV530_016353 [Patagioenas fasciata monilis]
MRSTVQTRTKELLLQSCSALKPPFLQVSAVSSCPFVVVLFFFPCWLPVFFNKAVMEASGPADVLGRGCCFTKVKQES